MTQTLRERNLALLQQSNYGGRGNARASDISAYGKGGGAEVVETKKQAKSIIRQYAKTINASLPEVIFGEDGSLEFRWHGARLMTFNELLHVTSYVAMVPYKKACHNACSTAYLIHPKLKKMHFPGRVDLTLTRVANAYVDPDAVTAMFKFFIDGLCKCGVINDDTRDYIRYIEPVQKMGEFMVSITIKSTELTDRQRTMREYMDKKVERAALDGDLDALKVLVEDGADIQSGDNFALRHAASNGDVDVVQYLLSKGADVHASLDCAIMWAAMEGHLAVVELLVENGATLVNASSCVPLRYAAKDNHLPVVQFIVNQLQSIDESELQVDLLMELGFSLKIAAAEGNLEVVSFLVDSGAPVDFNRYVAYRISVENNHEAVSRFLYQKAPPKL